MITVPDVPRLRPGQKPQWWVLRWKGEIDPPPPKGPWRTDEQWHAGLWSWWRWSTASRIYLLVEHEAVIIGPFRTRAQAREATWETKTRIRRRFLP